MLGTLFNWVRDIKDRIFCRSCDYRSLFAIGIIWHLKKAHNTKPTKRDLRFLLKYNLVSRLIKFIVACVLIPPLFVLKLVCYLLGEFSEIL